MYIYTYYRWIRGSYCIQKKKKAKQKFFTPKKKREKKKKETKESRKMETGRDIYVTGDVVSAMEVLVCEDSLQPKSAFSPLAGALASAAAASASVSAAYASRAAYCTTPIPSTRHRFLAAPYAGTGYLPTVIKPPNQSLHANGTSDAYQETSPDDASDKTSYSE